jgi:hypothetical protein
MGILDKIPFCVFACRERQFKNVNITLELVLVGYWRSTAGIYTCIKERGYSLFEEIAKKKKGARLAIE